MVNFEAWSVNVGSCWEDNRNSTERGLHLASESGDLVLQLFDHQLLLANDGVGCWQYLHTPDVGHGC